MTRRKPSAVQVLVFPKRARAPRTQSLTEVTAVEEVTDTGETRITSSSEPSQAQATGQMLALGHELFSIGKVREAKIVFEGLQLAIPEDAFVRTMLGTIALALEDNDGAYAHFEAALRRDPHDVAALVYRGEIRLQRRSAQKALKDFELAVAYAAKDDPFRLRAKKLIKLARARLGAEPAGRHAPRPRSGSK